MKKPDIDQLEAQLLATRQAKQMTVSVILGLMTVIFLDSIYILSAVLHSLSNLDFFFFFLIFAMYAVGGAFALGALARYAFIRHMKRVQTDIERIRIKRLLNRELDQAVTPGRGPVRPHGMNCAPSHPPLRA